MPRVIFQALEGRTAEQKRALVSGITDAVVSAYGVEPKTVTIVIEDIPRGNFAKAGTLASDG
jgi:4-oxalocrotonate tautomerase